MLNKNNLLCEKYFLKQQKFGKKAFLSVLHLFPVFSMTSRLIASGVTHCSHCGEEWKKAGTTLGLWEPDFVDTLNLSLGNRMSPPTLLCTFLKILIGCFLPSHLRVVWEHPSSHHRLSSPPLQTTFAAHKAPVLPPSL